MFSASKTVIDSGFDVMDRLLEVSILEISIIGAILFTSVYWTRRLLVSNIYSNTLPWVGIRKERFSMIRGSLRQLLGSVETLDEGYHKVRYSGE
jgi:hypothetical protein